MLIFVDIDTFLLLKLALVKVNLTSAIQRVSRNGRLSKNQVTRFWGELICEELMLLKRVAGVMWWGYDRGVGVLKSLRAQRAGVARTFCVLLPEGQAFLQ